MAEEVTLKKELGFAAALSTVMGTVIGAGVFFKASSVYATTGNESLGLIAWLLGGIITLCAGLTGAELAAAIPKTGGMLSYIEHTYGSLASYLLGWAQTIIYYPANIAALAIIFGTQFTNLFGLSSHWIIGVGIIASVSLTFLNCLGSKIGGAVQTISTICKLIPLALIVIFGLMQPSPEHINILPTAATQGAHGNVLSALGSGLLATMFAYDGWINVGNIAGEMKNPKKDLPKAISLGLIGIMIVYVLINVAFLMTLSVGQIAGNENAASDVAMSLFGSFGGKIVTIGILISVYGTINGYTMTGMRIPYIMAKENRLPFSNLWKKLSKSQVPMNAGLLILGIAIVYMLSGQFDTLTDMLVFVIWIFYTMTFLAVFILRKREPELERPYKVPGYPVVPAIALLGGLFIVINTLFTQTVLALIGIGVTAIGLIFYKCQSKGAMKDLAEELEEDIEAVEMNQSAE